MQQRASKSSKQSAPKKAPAKGQKKNFVLDTNVLLHDPRAIFAFEDNDVVIPIYVIEEIDTFKKDLERARPQRAPGRRASSTSCAPKARSRRACRSTAAARSASPIDARGAAARADDRSRPGLDRSHPRRRRSRTTRGSTAARAIFVTKDINLRIRADALGSAREDFEPEHDRHRRALHGHRELDVAGPVDRQVLRRGRHRAARRRTSSAATSTSCLTRQGQPAADRARPRESTRHGTARAGPSTPFKRGRVGHPPAQPRAALRARPAAQRRRSSW